MHSVAELRFTKALAFASAIKWRTMLPGYSAQHLITASPRGYSDTLTVVGVGGEQEHISLALVKHSPSSKCMVQSPADVIVQGQEVSPHTYENVLAFKHTISSRSSP